MSTPKKPKGKGTGAQKVITELFKKGKLSKREARNAKNADREPRLSGSKAKFIIRLV